ncbi:hypothetical protein ScPMuIL_017675 [Solemya velum]
MEALLCNRSLNGNDRPKSHCVKLCFRFISVLSLLLSVGCAFYIRFEVNKCCKQEQATPAVHRHRHERQKSVTLPSGIGDGLHNAKGAKGDTGPMGKQGPQGEKGAACRISGVHFTSTADSGKKVFQGGEKLQLADPVNWMKNNSDLQSLPLVTESSGGFLVNVTGLYLVYAHAVFHDALPYKAIQIYHNDGSGAKAVFRCVESNDFWQTDTSPEYNAKVKSCSVTGILYLESGHHIDVRNAYDDTEIALKKDGTYFGALLLSTNE